MTRSARSAAVSSLPVLALALALALGPLVACGGSRPETETRALPPADPRAVDKYVRASKLISAEGKGDGVRASALLHEALAIDPNLWEAHYNLGVLYRQQGALDRAAESLRKALEIQPAASEPRLALAEVEHARGELDVAAELLGQHLAAQPGDHAARVGLTAVLREQGKHEAALAQARTVLVRDGGNVAALLEVGRVYRAQQEHEVAELVFDRAEALAEKDPRPHDELGLTSLVRGDTQLAFEHFEAALALDPSFAPARLNQASVLLRAGDYAGAERAYRAVLEHEAGHDGAAVGLAIALRGQAKHEAALAEYEKVLARNPQSREAWFDLGVLHADFLDRAEAATKAFQKFLELGGGDDEAKARAEQYLEQLASRVKQ